MEEGAFHTTFVPNLTTFWHQRIGDSIFGTDIRVFMMGVLNSGSCRLLPEAL
jgi:hypothetical protein